MGKNLQKLYSFRTDALIIKKIEYIADKNTRNRNQQIEHLIKICIEEFEKENGELLLDDDGNITIARPQKMGKSTISKTS